MTTCEGRLVFPHLVITYPLTSRSAGTRIHGTFDDSLEAATGAVMSNPKSPGTWLDPSDTGRDMRTLAFRP